MGGKDCMYCKFVMAENIAQSKVHNTYSVDHNSKRITLNNLNIQLDKGWKTKHPKTKNHGSPETNFK